MCVAMVLMRGPLRSGKRDLMIPFVTVQAIFLSSTIPTSSTCRMDASCCSTCAISNRIWSTKYLRVEPRVLTFRSGSQSYQALDHVLSGHELKNGGGGGEANRA